MTLPTRALPRRGAVCRVVPPILVVLSVLMIGPGVVRAATTPNPSTGDPLPEGVTASDWRSIRAAHEAWKHAIRPVKGGWQARNPAQQWTTKFDGRGFEAKPQGGDWTWGLELRSYGAGDEQRELSGTPAVKTEGHRLAYHWDNTVQEWYVNDGRGLEHGFSVQERPPGPADAPLTFVLATRGSLRAAVTSDARGVDYRDKSSATVLTYSGLRVWDAEGRELEARFAPAEDGVALQVDAKDARYPLLIDPIARQAYLKASNTEIDPDGDGDRFGTSVAISGDTVVVGAPMEDSNATFTSGNQADNSAKNYGAAYVFVRDGSVWSQQAYLKASNAESKVSGLDDGDRFGTSVAISGDTVVVGAPNEDSNATGVNGNQADNSAISSGAAYVFVRNGFIWSQQAYLKASKAEDGARFGRTVAISGDTLVAGAISYPGERSAAHVFVRNGSSWSQQAHLQASSPLGGASNFAGPVAISGDTVVVGSAEDSGAAGGQNYAGAVYVFVRSGSVWSQQAYLTGSNTEAGDNFGDAVAISGDTLVVGAYGEKSNATGVNGNQADNSAASSGAAYVFVRNGSVWSQQAYLKPAVPISVFGRGVAVSDNTLVVGAVAEGAAYVFVRNGSVWSQQTRHQPPNAHFGDNFGAAVAMSGTTVVVGARFEDSSATGVNGNEADNSTTDSGAAYVFILGDSDGDGLPDEWEMDGKGIDANGDGKIDLDLFALGARPDRKDLFVEVDTAGYVPAGWNGAAQWPPFQMVIDAFAKAPVSNPDGTQGITLHIERSDTTAQHELTPVVKRRFPDNFQQNKTRLFGSAEQREDTNNSTNILAAKAMAFRYCIIYDDLPFQGGDATRYGGLAELAGDDFAMNITDGTSDGKFDKEELASIFMHELGHTLGLGHGGLDDIQGKPNYPSIMNYALAYPRGWNAAFWRLDFSREGGPGDGGSLPVLDESGLVESTGINSKLYKRFHMPVGVPLDSVSPSATKRTLKLIKLDGTGFDYNGDGAIDQTPVSGDLNFIGAGAGFGGVDQPTFPEPLEPHNDWANLIYAVNPLNTNSAGFYIDENCPTLEIADFLDANIEPPVIEKEPQTVVFTQPDRQVFSPGGTFLLSASSDSELPVRFISGNTNRVAISGNLATILGAGRVAITATNRGNDIFLPAGQKRTLVVDKAAQSITFRLRETQSFKKGRTFTLSATATSDLGVSFTSSKPKVLSIKGNKATILRKGEVTITASQGGNGNYLAAQSVPRKVRIK